MIKGHIKTFEVSLMFNLNPLNEGLWSDPLLFSPQHDRRPMGVICTDIMARMPPHLLEPCPDVGLDVFHQMTEMDWTIGIGEGASDENMAGLSHRGLPSPHRGCGLTWGVIRDSGGIELSFTGPIFGKL